MHGSLQLVDQLLGQLRQAPASSVQLLVIPPYPYLTSAQALLASSNILLGAQDCSAQAQGAYTGEVAATMLADVGASHVLIGHSERRTYHAETNALLLAKTQQALAAGLTPIICVGETLAEHEAGQTEQVVSQQINSLISHLDASQLEQLILAYEPVWAIGTGLTATPEQAQQVHAHLRSELAKHNPEAAAKILILYGGSMKADNAQDLLAMPDIDGGLVGGAALDADQFLAILKAAEKTQCTL